MVQYSDLQTAILRFYSYCSVPACLQGTSSRVCTRVPCYTESIPCVMDGASGLLENPTPLELISN